MIAESAEDLQDLTAYASYCETWKLLVNSSKTKIVFFSKHRVQNYNFVLNNETLEIVKEFKYLGKFLICIDCTISLVSYCIFNVSYVAFVKRME